MNIPDKTKKILIERFDPELLWIVGTTALSNFVDLKPGDIDIIVGNHSLEEIMDALKDLGVRKKAYWKDKFDKNWAYGVKIQAFGMDIWPDNIDEYVDAVPFPTLRVGINMASGHALTGIGFADSIKNKIIEIPDNEPHGRMISKKLMVGRLTHLARRTRFRFGPNLKKWAKIKNDLLEEGLTDGSCSFMEGEGDYDDE